MKNKFLKSFLVNFFICLIVKFCFQYFIFNSDNGKIDWVIMLIDSLVISLLLTITFRKVIFPYIKTKFKEKEN